MEEDQAWHRDRARGVGTKPRPPACWKDSRTFGRRSPNQGTKHQTKDQQRTGCWSVTTLRWKDGVTARDQRRDMRWWPPPWGTTGMNIYQHHIPKIPFVQGISCHTSLHHLYQHADLQTLPCFPSIIDGYRMWHKSQ